MTTVVTRTDLALCDVADPLREFRKLFDLPDDLIYLDGNSLGPVSRHSAERVRRVVQEQWGQDLIKSWNKHGWIDLPQRAGEKIAKLVGAKPNEVIVADSTSVNLFKLLAAALRLRPGRTIILSEDSNFPTDLYIAQGLIDLLGGQHELRLVDGTAILGSIKKQTAVVMLTHVHYKTGRIHEMEQITKKAHEAGALVIWDLAHSAGALPVDLNGCNVDFAVGCGYKYLNGGPGAPAFLYVAERLQNEIKQPLSGWMGHKAPFEFGTDYEPAQGITRNLCGTPPILSLSSLDASLDIALAADMKALREKSMALGDVFIRLIEQECPGFGIECISPPAAQRGSQVSFTHENAYAIMQTLIQRGVVGDFRAPDVMRFGFAPLYIRYADVWDAVATLRNVLETRAWEQPQYRVRASVT